MTHNVESMTHTALIIVDVQESFRVMPSWKDISNPNIVEPINELVKHARINQDYVVWVLHQDLESGTPFDPVNGHVKLLSGLNPVSEDIQVTKTSHNAFTTTNLGQQLQSRGVTHLRIAGIRTEQCVETTTRLASDLGYEVEVVLDATATHPLPLIGTDEILSAAQVIERTAAALTGRFASITSVEQVVAQ